MREKGLLSISGYISLGVAVGLLALSVFVLISFDNEEFMPSHQHEYGLASVLPSDSPTGLPNSSDSPVSATDSSDIEQLLEFTSTFQRTLSLHILLAGASEEKLQDLFVLAESTRPSSFRNEIQDAIIRKLSILSPLRAIEQLNKVSSERRIGVLVEKIFEELSIEDLDNAVEHAISLDSLLRQGALRGILQGREGLSTTQLRKIAIQFGNEQFVIDEIARARVGNILDNPITEWNEVLDWYGNDIGSLSEDQFELLVYIAEISIEQNGTYTLDMIYSSLGNDDGRILLFSRLLKEFESSNPQSTLAMAQWLNVKDREVLSQAMANWTQSGSPQEALKTATKIESGDSRMRIQRSVLRAWIQSNPVSLLGYVDHIPVRLQEWSKHEALLTMTWMSPDLVPGFLENAESGLTIDIVIGNLARGWAESDPHSALKWVRSDPRVHERRTQLMPVILKSLAKDDPSLALSIALNEPLTDSQIGMEALVIGGATLADSEQGIAMLEKARNQETLEIAYIEVGSALVKKGEIDRAMELSTSASEDFQFDYFNGLALTWALSDPESMLDRLESMPSVEIRENLAQVLVLVNKNTSVLSTEQLNELARFLPK